jgi:copper oxidase (laccase) domain-containing protein
MIAAIGPSLGPCCAEFINYKDEIPRQFWPFRVDAHHFDFWRISRHQLTTAGLAQSNIHSSGICTRCNPHLFFSYRAARQTGRFAALIGLDMVS